MAVINTSNITSILDANKIKYNSKIKTFRQIAFSSEAIQTFAEESIKNLETIVIAGVNGGFRDKRYIEAVQDLIDSLVNLGDRNAQKKFEKTKKEIKEIEDMVMGFLDRNKDQIDVRERLNIWVNKIEEGLKVLKTKYKEGEGQYKYIFQFAEYIDRIDQELSNVVDVSSEEAVKYANEIIQLFEDFKQKVVEEVLDSTASKVLMEVLDKINSWSKIKETSKRKGKIEDLPEYEEGEFDSIISNDDIIERLDIFQSNLEKLKEKNTMIYGVDHYNEQILENEQEIKNKEAEIDKLYTINEEYVNKIQNGEIYAEDVQDILEYNMQLIGDLKNEIHDLQQENINIRKSIKDTTDAKRAAERIVKEIEKIIKDIYKYKVDFVMIDLLSRDLDLGGLTRVMKGQYDSEDDAIIILGTIRESVKKIYETRLTITGAGIRVNGISEQAKNGAKPKVGAQKETVKTPQTGEKVPFDPNKYIKGVKKPAARTIETQTEEPNENTNTNPTNGINIGDV